MLNRASTVILGMSVLAAGVGVAADKASGADFNGTSAAAWIVVGFVSAASLGALTLFGERLLKDRMLAQHYPGEAWVVPPFSGSPASTRNR